MLPPRVWTATATARLLVLLLRDGRCGIHFTGKPAGVHPLDMVGEDLSFLRLGAGIRLCVLLGQLARMHHEKAPFLLRHPPITVLDLYGAEHAVAMPLAACFVLGTPRLFHEQGKSWLLRAPRFQFLAHRTGAWHKGHQAQALVPTQA
jgi:hypothetical protein